VAKSRKQRDRERRKAERLACGAEIRKRAGCRTAAKYAAGKIPKGKNKPPKQGTLQYFDGGRLQLQMFLSRTRSEDECGTHLRESPSVR
jgi:hypothetical protein